MGASRIELEKITLIFNIIHTCAYQTCNISNPFDYFLTLICGFVWDRSFVQLSLMVDWLMVFEQLWPLLCSEEHLTVGCCANTVDSIFFLVLL